MGADSLAAVLIAKSTSPLASPRFIDNGSCSQASSSLRLSDFRITYLDAVAGIALEKSLAQVASRLV